MNLSTVASRERIPTHNRFSSFFGMAISASNPEAPAIAHAEAPTCFAPTMVANLARCALHSGSTGKRAPFPFCVDQDGARPGSCRITNEPSEVGGKALRLREGAVKPIIGKGQRVAPQHLFEMRHPDSPRSILRRCLPDLA